MALETKNNDAEGNVGEDGHLNENCWLVENLKYPLYKRCQYCDLRFKHCLFLHYQLISILLVSFSFLLVYLFERELPPAMILVVFLMVIVYGYYFNNSTEKIIKSNYLEKKAKNELKQLSDELEDRVEEQTRNIRMQNEHLEQLLSVKTDFLRTVNHQLNTPLSIMKSAFSMIEDKSLSKEEGLKIAAHGLERMSDTVEDFWNVFELDEEQTLPELTETDIEKVFGAMVEEKKKLGLTLSRKLRIQLLKPDFPVPRVLCDQKKIGHVVSNLLDNAVLYTQQGSIKVWFEKTTEGKREYLKVLIKDTGEGVSLEDREKIFEKFNRGSATASVNPNGSGLGLYIARKIIQDSKGELRLEESEVGKGSTFSFTLQIAK